MGLRDDALRTIGAVPSERVSVAGLLFEVRGLTVKDAAALYQRISRRTPRGEVEVDRERAMPEWVIACTYDPESGERVFDPADRDSLVAGQARVVNELGSVAMRLSGFGGEEGAAAAELKSGSVEAGDV